MVAPTWYIIYTRYLVYISTRYIISGTYRAINIFYFHPIYYLRPIFSPALSPFRDSGALGNTSAPPPSPLPPYDRPCRSFPSRKEFIIRQFPAPVQTGPSYASVHTLYIKKLRIMYVYVHEALSAAILKKKKRGKKYHFFFFKRLRDLNS